MKAMKLRTVSSDGHPCEPAVTDYYPIDPDTGRPYDGDTPDGPPGVVIQVRAISREVDKEIRERHTKPEVVKGVGIHETIDSDAINDDRVCYAIVSWTGILGADNKPLRCVDGAKKALDPIVRMGVVNQALRPAVVEVAAETFRQPT